MGHKVNPDIFRLGVSKTWVFQFRTNKNFIKNLFLFKFLRNLFMNYTIPFFDFNNRRNQKINDKLILRGEDQLVASPFVKNNLLFSHVFYGLLKNKVYIESFFIDVSFKQQRKKTENIKRSQLLDISEFKPWNSHFYKTSVVGRLDRKNKKYQTKLKKIFGNRVFKFIGRKSKDLKIKPIKKLSKNFYSFIRSINYKHHRELKRFLNLNYKVYAKRIPIKKRFKGKIRRKIYSLRVFRIKKKRVSFTAKTAFEFFKFKILGRGFLNTRQKNFKKNFEYMKTLFFMKKRLARRLKRIRQRLGLRYMRKSRKFNFDIKYKYKYRSEQLGYKKIILPKLLSIASTSYFASREVLAYKRGFPKNPFYVFDFAISNEKLYTFYANYKNLKLLKYFIRTLKYLKFFSLKKKIFFSQNLISLLMNFLGLVNSTVLTKKMYLLLQGLIFYTLSFSFFNFLNFKKNFFSRFVFFKGVSKTVYRSIIDLTNNNKMNFSVVGQNKFRFNSSLVLNYILIKLSQYFTIHEIVNPLSYYIKGLTSIAGYKILITGRLTRKERAAVMIRSGKRMPLSTIKANIDYSAGFKIMKFGLVGIKVYLLLNPSTLLNLYKFQYNYN